MKIRLSLMVILIWCGFLTSCQENHGLVVGKVKKASKLTTAEFTIDKIVYGVKRKKLLWVVKLSDAKFVAHSKALIKAGVDLEKLKEKDVKIKENSISLKLPAVEIINFSYPAESFVLDSMISDNQIFNKISLEDQEQYFQNAEMDIRNSLQYMGIVKTTEKKTRVMLEILLRSMGYTEVYIDFYKDKLITEITEEE